MEKGQDPRYFQSLLIQKEGGGVLAGIQSIDLPRTLKDVFPDDYLDQLARETGFVKRLRKINPINFFWTLILCFGKTKARTVAGFRHCYAALTGCPIVPSAFYARFNARLVAMLKAAIDRALTSFQLIGTGDFTVPFRDVILADASVIKLLDGLKKAFPGCRTNSAPAAVKLHTFVSVKGVGRTTISITSERKHELKKLRIGPWVQGNLLVFDLGYFRFQLFNCIDRNGGFFLTRLKEKANPVITKVHRHVRGNSVTLEGRRLQETFSALKREILDVDAEVTFENRVYAGHRRIDRASFRIVALRDDRTGKYHTYITNIPPGLLDAEAIASCYRSRWAIELLFKELKSGYRIDQVPSAKKAVAEAFLYASILTLIVSRRLFRLFADGEGGRRFRIGRWFRLFSAHSGTILGALLDHRRYASPLNNLIVTLTHELADPHLKRQSLLESTIGKFTRRKNALIGSPAWGCP